MLAEQQPALYMEVYGYIRHNYNIKKSNKQKSAILRYDLNYLFLNKCISHIKFHHSRQPKLIAK